MEDILQKAGMIGYTRIYYVSSQDQSADTAPVSYTHLAWVLDINPLYYFVSFMRSCIINGISPEPMVYVQCALFALVTLFIGAYVFKKSQDKFILYL